MSRTWQRVCGAVVLALGAGAASPAHADALALIVNGKSIHFRKPANQPLNDNNWGLGFEYEFGTKSDPWVPMLTAGGYRDSNDNPSYYGGGGLARRFTFGPDRPDHLDIGVVAFVMTRELYRHGYPFFAALPYLSWGTDRIAVNMTYIPKVDTRIVPALFFQLKIGLGR